MIALAGIATSTTRIGLGVSVYLAALRNPIVAAKLVSSLDQLSGGRVRLGVGAGWIPEEYETFGIEFANRGKVLDEHLACMRALWTEAEPRFEGEYYQIGNIGFEPKPVQARLPLWIGGNSRPARARAVNLGDGWHVIDVPIPELEQGIQDLKARCRAAGRDPKNVTISMRAQVLVMPHSPSDKERFAPLVGTQEEIVRDLKRMQKIGVDHVALWPAGQDHTLDSYLDRLDFFATALIPDVVSKSA
jgi:probable F420-dependent oxidoreductase